MAKYNYAPLSIDETRRKAAAAGEQDHMVHERMPMCVGICVLLAIVYVLSRTGDRDAIMDSHNVRSVPPPVPAPAVDAVPVNSRTVTAVPEPVASTSMYDRDASKGENVWPRPKQETTNTYTFDASAAATPPEVSTAPEVASTNMYDRDASKGTNVWPRPKTGTAESGYNFQSEETTSVATTATTAASTVTSTENCNCEDNSSLDENDLMAKLRQKALANTPPHIIECAAANAGESQAACHLPSETRFAALKQKGATLWMTGCSGSGKTTIATMLEDKLVKAYGKHVYRLDGDNLRTGLNRDLTFSEADRAESVRRTGELATLFSDAGIITLVGLISPYRADRDAVRERHEAQGIPFYEIFLDVPVEELKKRDPKKQYERVESGELKHFTCIDDPYEAPIYPEITLRTHELAIEESAEILFRQLERDGILQGAPKLTPPGLPNPDGDEMIDLHVAPEDRAARIAEAAELPKVRITDIELNWLQTIGEGWAAPLKGFMREGALLETLHFNSLLVDPFNLTGNVDRLYSKTEFDDFPEYPPPNRVSMSVPITLSCTSFTKTAIEISGKSAVALVTQMGQTVAILRNPEIYDNRKEEIVTRMFGAIDMGHPYVQHIYKGGDYLIGGEVELLDRIRYNDGLDQWRLTATELLDEFTKRGADTVYAFQTRNPTHAGHAYLMRSAGEDLRAKGYQNPILWLSPLGGWTKSDDVPLDVRVKQHEEVLKAGTTHPGGLDPQTTVMAIWPAPMVYAGPTEVQFHAKSRRSAGASFFVVGRDPAGMKGSMEAFANPDDDLYDGNHGRYVLQNSPGIGDMQMLSFVKVMYDISDNVMKIPDESRMQDFISISGTKMRTLARQGAVPCSPTNIPTDLLQANCIPSGFMVPNGWDGVVDYYKHSEESRWIPWSQPIIDAPADLAHTQPTGRFGSTEFRLTSNQYPSFWHDVPMAPAGGEPNVINLITEIPMFVSAKMEVSKEDGTNAIIQDTNKDGSPRYYTYGTPFFNYGLIAQTWEDPNVRSAQGHAGDNDPLDVIEFGSEPLLMGSVTPCRVLGSLELIDEGETDHKVLCIALSDKDSSQIHSMQDLDRVKPGTLNKLLDWLKRYKTSDGKPENAMASDEPKTVEQTMAIIGETHERWRALCGLDGTPLSSLHASAATFGLSSSSCRGSTSWN